MVLDILWLGNSVMSRIAILLQERVTTVLQLKSQTKGNVTSMRIWVFNSGIGFWQSKCNAIHTLLALLLQTITKQINIEKKVKF